MYVCVHFKFVLPTLQVIPNLNSLFESPKLDRELRAMIRDNFREFCPVGIGGNTELNHNIPMDHPLHQIQHYQIIDDCRLQPPQTVTTVQQISETPTPFMRSESSEADLENDVKFSDDEEPAEPAVKCEETDDDDDLPLSKVDCFYLPN